MHSKAYKIIIQARSNSSRLPGKMLKPFYKGKSILKIILDNLKADFSSAEIVLATTDKKEDDALANLGNIDKIHVYRGSENDVLGRFVEAAHETKAKNIIRVCADNPFIIPKYIHELINEICTNQYDYVGFAFPDGTPTIRSHVGLFAEAVSIDALIKVRQATNESIYLEHVTNYIYSHPEQFRIKLIPVPKGLEFRKDIRLTIDTLEDFEMAQRLISSLGKHPSLENLITFIDSNPKFIEQMEAQIRKNSK